MIKLRPSSRFRKRATVYTQLWIGLVFAFYLACCGQTAENIDPQTGQTQPQPEAKGTQPATIQQPRGQKFLHAPDEVLVKFKPETDAKTIINIQTELKLETVHKFSSPHLYLMKITDGASVEAIIERLNSYDAVKYAEPNYEVKTTQ